MRGAGSGDVVDGDRSPAEALMFAPAPRAYSCLNPAAAPTSGHDGGRASSNHPMTTEDIISLLRSRTAELHEMGVVHISLFGSRTRGDHRRNSDLDILVSHAPDRHFSLIDMVHIENEVGDWLSLIVHVTVRQGLSDRFYNRIMNELLVVF